MYHSTTVSTRYFAASFTKKGCISITEVLTFAYQYVTCQPYPRFSTKETLEWSGNGVYYENKDKISQERLLGNLHYFKEFLGCWTSETDWPCTVPSHALWYSTWAGATTSHLYLLAKVQERFCKQIFKMAETAVQPTYTACSAEETSQLQCSRSKLSGQPTYSPYVWTSCRSNTRTWITLAEHPQSRRIELGII